MAKLSPAEYAERNARNGLTRWGDVGLSVVSEHGGWRVRDDVSGEFITGHGGLAETVALCQKIARELREDMEACEANSSGSYSRGPSRAW